MSLLSVREAADRLGVAYSTVKQWIYKGSVRSVRTDGCHHRISEREVTRLLAQRGALPPGVVTLQTVAYWSRSVEGIDYKGSWTKSDAKVFSLKSDCA